MQKQRQIDPNEPLHERDRVYEEPRRAVTIAINGKFSFIAIGTQRFVDIVYDWHDELVLTDVVNSGGLEFTNFPAQEGVTPKSQDIRIPNPYNRQTGEVCALEWSSDGYVLAVGWRHGWGIFSVGGRCLASGFGVDDIVDEDRYVPCHRVTFETER